MSLPREEKHEDTLVTHSQKILLSLSLLIRGTLTALLLIRTPSGDNSAPRFPGSWYFAFKDPHRLHEQMLCTASGPK
jgi:hypothetical protein